MKIETFERVGPLKTEIQMECYVAWAAASMEVAGEILAHIDSSDAEKLRNVNVVCNSAAARLQPR